MKTKQVGDNYNINTGHEAYLINQDKLNSGIDILTDKFTDLFVFLDDMYENEYAIFDTVDKWTMGKIREISNQLKYSVVDIENLKTKLTMDDDF